MQVNNSGIMWRAITTMQSILMFSWTKRWVVCSEFIYSHRRLYWQTNNLVIFFPPQRFQIIQNPLQQLNVSLFLKRMLLHSASCCGAKTSLFPCHVLSKLVFDLCVLNPHKWTLNWKCLCSHKALTPNMILFFYIDIFNRGTGPPTTTAKPKETHYFS